LAFDGRIGRINLPHEGFNRLSDEAVPGAKGTIASMKHGIDEGASGLCRFRCRQLKDEKVMQRRLEQVVTGITTVRQDQHTVHVLSEWIAGSLNFRIVSKGGVLWVSKERF
jgi:hypothetical protein